MFICSFVYLFIYFFVLTMAHILIHSPPTTPTNHNSNIQDGCGHKFQWTSARPYKKMKWDDQLKNVNENQISADDITKVCMGVGGCVCVGRCVSHILFRTPNVLPHLHCSLSLLLSLLLPSSLPLFLPSSLPGENLSWALAL